MDSGLFKDFISKLCDKLKTDSPHLLPSAQDELIWDTDPSQVLLQAESDTNDNNDDEDDPLLGDEHHPSDIEMGAMSKHTPPNSPSGDDSGSGKTPERLYPTAPTDDFASDGSTASAHSTEV